MNSRSRLSHLTLHAFFLAAKEEGRTEFKQLVANQRGRVEFRIRPRNLRSFAALGFAFLDHAQAFDGEIVNLDRAKMQPIGIRPQDAQAPDGQRTDRQSAERKRTDCERARRHRWYAHGRQYEIIPSPAPDVLHRSMLAR